MPAHSLTWQGCKVARLRCNIPDWRPTSTGCTASRWRLLHCGQRGRAGQILSYYRGKEYSGTAAPQATSGQGIWARTQRERDSWADSKNNSEKQAIA